MAEPRPAAVSTDGDGVTAWLHAGMSPTLCRYIGRLHVARLVTVIAVFAGVIFLADLIELLRRAADEPVSFPMVMGMAALKVPEALQETIPFATLIATLAPHWRLSRASEVIAMRAAGVSPWQLLAPTLAMAFALGILAALVLNPLGAVLLSRFERLEALHLRGGATLLDVAGGGIWLRQADGEGEAVIHATGIAGMVTGRTLAEVTVLRFDRDGRFLERIDARRAQLDGGVWRLGQTIVRRPSAVANSSGEVTLASGLTAVHLREGFRAPQAVSFWDLGDYAAALGAIGVPIQGYTLARHRLLALPLLLAATALIAAAFSLRGPRRGGVTMIIGAGVLMGFLLYSLSDIAFALALSAKVPAPLAAWAPAVASMLLGTALLLHLEDG